MAMSYQVDHFEVLEDPAQWPETLTAFREYWESKRADREMLRRCDFDPIDVPRHLPDLMLIDLAPDGSDFTYRVVGTRIAETVGYDRTGQSASAAYSGDAELGDVLLTLAQHLRATRKPFAVRAALYWVDRDHIGLDAGVYPLAGEGGEVTMALVECRFRSTKGTGGSRAR